MSIDEAKQLVQQFEECRLPKEQWTHESHFIMAFWYCSHQPLPIAIEAIREGIKRYNVSIGGANTDHSGYHETITVFYTRLIINYILEKSDWPIEIKLSRLMQEPFLQKDFPLKYYSKELLASRQARRTWVEPDKQALFQP